MPNTPLRAVRVPDNGSRTVAACWKVALAEVETAREDARCEQDGCTRPATHKVAWTDGQHWMLTCEQHAQPNADAEANLIGPNKITVEKLEG